MTTKVMLSMIAVYLQELEAEAKITRKMLALVPDDKHDWKPHEKSMPMVFLSTHIAELPGWINMAIHTDGLDFGADKYEPKTVKNNTELLQFFETTLAKAKADLEKFNEDELSKEWVLRNGKTVLYKSTKGETIRMTYSQIVHHRAQLGVYLRLLNIPIPGTYGPSADEQG